MGLVPTNAVSAISVSIPAWWESALWSALLGAIVGGLISGLISWLLAWGASRSTLQRDREARMAAEKAIALVVTLKAQTILNGMHSLLKHLNDALEQAKSAGHGSLSNWQKVQPIVGLGEPTRFEYQELAVIIEMKNDKLTNGLPHMSERWSVILMAIRSYSEERVALTNELEVEKVEGPVMTTIVTPEFRAKYVARMAGLDALVSHVMRDLREYLKDSVSCCEELQPTFKAHFKTESFPGFVSGDATSEINRAV